MKRFMIFSYLVIMAALLLACGAGGYGDDFQADKASPALDVVDSVMDADWTETGKTYIDISTGGNGFYSMIGDVEVRYYNGEISCITIKEPVLLSFQVSSEYGGGVWLLNMDDGQAVIDELTETLTLLHSSGKEESAAARIESVLDILSRSGPYTNTNT